jgi:hypothetical protein
MIAPPVLPQSAFCALKKTDWPKLDRFKAQWSWHRAGNRVIAGSNPTSAHLWRRPCGVAWDAVPEPMVEYIDPGFSSFWF